MNAVPVQGGLSRRVFRVLWWLFAILLVLVSAGFIFDSAVVAYFRWQYPYGWSHCCLLGLRGSLEEYAKRHDGHFPAGAGCPEASLSLLYREGLTDANTLRGKTVPEKVVKDILERGELLGPDTCGWHYVEGLTLAE